MLTKILAITVDVWPWLLLGASLIVAWFTPPMSGGTALGILFAYFAFRILYRRIPGRHAKPRYRRNSR